MSDHLICIAQASRIDNFVAFNDDGIVQTSSLNEPLLYHRSYFFINRKCAAGGNFIFKTLLIERERIKLGPNRFGVGIMQSIADAVFFRRKCDEMDISLGPK